MDIQCCCITAISELLTNEDRAAIRRAFGIPPVSGFVCTEGLAGHTQPGDAVLRFATDICIIELASSLRQAGIRVRHNIGCEPRRSGV